MNLKKDIQTQPFKWLLGSFLIVATGLLVYQLRRLFVKPKPTKQVAAESDLQPEPEVPEPQIIYYYANNETNNEPQPDESMTFPFVNLLEQTFTHNKGRLVKTEVFDTNGKEMGVSVSQTINTVTVRSNVPVSGTLYIQ